MNHRAFAALLLLLTAAAACRSESSEQKTQKRKDAPSLPQGQKPHAKTLYIPEESADVVDLSGDEHRSKDVSFGAPPPGAVSASLGVCPPEMVLIQSRFCIDRFEVSMVDTRDGRPLSPHYPPSQERSSSLFERWSRKAAQSGREYGRKLALPVPSHFQLTEKFAPRAQSLRSVLPAGYLNRGLAEASCKNAGKRLCLREEWVTACRGQADTQFPYGNEYQDGVCNVHRNSHPARLLHGDSSRNHLDPRLGLAQDDDGPLLRQTGETTECVSRWGHDGVYDMVGNIDEWIHEESGSFLGGFFSRGTKAGCEASIDSHDPGYLDYSLGTRCCKTIGQ